jgi:hypothetical protein
MSKAHVHLAKSTFQKSANLCGSLIHGEMSDNVSIDLTVCGFTGLHIPS